jgi:hypothetical protein
MGTSTFAPGATIARRDVLNGRVWTAAPHRVLSDDGETLVLVTWPGTVGYTPVNWITWFRDNDEAARQRALDDLISGGGQIGPWTWQDTTVVTWIGLDPDFSLQLYLAVDGGPEQWKVNFERPIQRTAIGVDTCDLLLDLITDPGANTWRWKDEEEYERLRQAGLVPESEHERVQAARQRALVFTEAGRGPLAEDWTTWRVPADWPLPTLPDGVLTTHQ